MDDSMQPAVAGTTAPLTASQPRCTVIHRPGRRRTLRGTDLRLLTRAFTMSSSLRVVSYLPPLWAIHASGDSSQQLLWTWRIRFGSNPTMAAWLCERERARINKSIVVSACNAAMCGAAVLLIVWHRL